MELWNDEIELQFFRSALKHYAVPEKLFYKLNSEFYAYVPKSYKRAGQTLQSRNSLIGKFTEKWCRDILDPIAKKFGLYAVNTVKCKELGLINRSEADLAFCTTDSNIQEYNNIKLVFEIKMSIVSNYKYLSPKDIKFVGDYKTHIGNPSFLRSDSMLKAIGKSINIRVSGLEAAKIPIIILGNAPITDNYAHKVDFLKTSGVVQGFWSLNPAPTNSSYIDKTQKNGFQTIIDMHVLQKQIDIILNMNLDYFSSMISKTELGEYIRIAGQENSDETKAEKFLKLIRGYNKCNSIR